MAEPKDVFGGMGAADAEGSDDAMAESGPSEAFTSMIQGLFPDFDDDKISQLWEAIKECTEGGY